LKRFNEKTNYLPKGAGLQGLTSRHRTKTILFACFLLLIPVFCTYLLAQEKKTQSAVLGQRIFAGNCATCHALDGQGSDRGPDIANRREVQSRTDQELLRIISNGIPAKGMPSFRALGTPAIQAVLQHLRELQNHGKSEPLSGDAKNGQKLFFQKAECSNCHTMKGKGGFIASDLSKYVSGRGAAEIRDVIVNPAKNIDPRKSAMVVITVEGKTYRGVVRNEDNFSLQLQTLDGVFHLFNKAELRSFEYESHPLMPVDYGTRLTRSEIDDLISYLLSSAGNNKQKPNSEWEYE
jgi:cytochrome c oxidase cbb3-type subunit III